MGLKRVRERRNDALAGEDWARVERLLADYYRGQSYAVEHCGTGGRAARFDGGVDLRLRRDGETILVQCKHWNAYQVPHNAVHQLLGIMVNEQATGAIVVTSGEFTRAAIEAATRHGHVQLVDGDDLRRMLGAGFNRPAAGAWAPAGRDDRWKERSGSFGTWAAERLVSAAEDRIRGGGKRCGMSIVAAGAWSGLAAILIKFILAIALLFFMSAALQRAIRSIAPVQPQASTTQATRQQGPADSTLVHESPTRAPPMATIHLPTPQEIEDQRRRSAESMEILSASTPELPDDPRRRSVLQ
ncbi:restriction endonuclease [Luteimonas sp. MJ250]|uniref:restriction endonuclease n=1 Tax=Luteimonas sp. MJ250 TaxID=3129236 RepID=UPI0031BBC937